MQGIVSIAKETLVFSGSSLIVNLLAFFLGIYVRRFLGPEAMGVWALLQVFLAYIAFANLGVFSAAYRNIPILRGRGEMDRIEKIKNSSFTYVIISSAIIGGVFFSGTLLFRYKFSVWMFWGLLSLVFLSWLQKLNNFQIGILYTEKRFSFVGFFKIGSAVVNALLVTLLVWRYHFYGLLVATLFSYLFNVVFLRWRSGVRFKLRYDRSEMKELLSSGIPLVVLGASERLLAGIDKIVIAKFLGVGAVGIYTVATLTTGYILMFPNIFQTVLFPRILEKFGDSQAEEARRKYSTLPVQMVVIYFSVAVALCWIIAPSLCRIFLPQYNDGMGALKILLFGNCFMALISMLGNVLFGQSRHLWMIPIYLFLSLSIFGLSHFILVQKEDITWIAFFVSVAYLCAYIFGAWFAWSPFYSRKEVILFIGRTLRPIFYTLLILLFFDAIWPKDLWIFVFLKMILFCLIWIGFLKSQEKKSEVIRLSKEAFFFWRQSKQEVKS